MGRPRRGTNTTKTEQFVASKPKEQGPTLTTFETQVFNIKKSLNVSKENFKAGNIASCLSKWKEIPLSERYHSKTRENKRQGTTGPTATTVQSSKQLIVNLHAKNQKILEQGSEYNFEKVHFEPKFDLLTPHQAWEKVFPKATYTQFSVLLVSNFMQKIKKIWHVVQKIFLKKAILGPKFDLLTPAGPGQELS